MVLDHVAQCTGPVVIGAAVPDAYLFRHGDMYLLHERTVPHRLEETIGEPERQDVLNRLFAQIVIDAVDLLLAENAQQKLVELARRLQVVAKGFLHHQPGVAAVFGQTGFAQTGDHGFDQGRPYGQIKDPVGPLRPVPGEFVDRLFQRRKSAGIGEICGHKL